MLIKSAITLVVTTVTAAQGTNSFIQFTNPVGSSMAIIGGQDSILSWINPCVHPYTKVSATPTHTEVQLFDMTNSTNMFLGVVGYIDCSVATQGSIPWAVPANLANPSKSYSLKIAVSPATDSGTFQILNGLSGTSSYTDSEPVPTFVVPSETPPPNGGGGASPKKAEIAIIVVSMLLVLVAIVFSIWTRRRGRVNKKASLGEEDDGSGLVEDVTKSDGELKGDWTVPEGTSSVVLMEEK